MDCEKGPSVGFERGLACDAFYFSWVGRSGCNNGKNLRAMGWTLVFDQNILWGKMPWDGGKI